MEAHERSQLKSPPRAAGNLLSGNLSELRRDPLEFYTNLHKNLGDVVHYRLGFTKCYMLTKPEGIQHVLKDNHSNYRKTVFYKKMRPLVGLGLLTSDGEFWRQQRRLSQPAFHRDQLERYATVMSNSVHSMLAKWSQRNQVELTEEMMSLTLEIGSQSLFGTELVQEADSIKKATTTTLNHMMHKFESLFDVPEFIPTPRNLRFQKANRNITQAVSKIIANKRQIDSSKDLLTSLMKAKDEKTGASMSEKQLRDEVVTLLLASQETTAMALCWTLYLLSKHPIEQKRIERELETELKGNPPTASSVSQLTYLNQVIQESMRLYPPAWWYGRTPIKDDEICGFRIPAGSVITILPYVLHRDPTIWPNPEQFIPSRFSESETAKRSIYSYIPFAAGPRNCIGKDFALLEIKLILANILRRFRLVNRVEEPLKAIPGVTLRPEPRLNMHLFQPDRSPRKSSHVEIPVVT